MSKILFIAVILICAGCGTINNSVKKINESMGNKSIEYPKASADADFVISLQSNIDKTSFFVDDKYIATGRRIKVMIDDRKEHTIKTVPEGYVAKEEFVQPPYSDGFLLSFTYMMGDRDATTVAGTESQNKVVWSDIDQIPVVSAKKDPRKKAIVIGIENYRQNLPKVDFAASDANTVSTYLTKVLGYQEENVVVLVNDHALKSDFEKYIGQWLKNNVDEDSKVLFYYSGHGSPNPKTGDAYLVPYDGDPTFIDSTGYSLKLLYETLGRLPAKEVVVILDSCFSGSGGRSVLAEGARPLVMNTGKTNTLPNNVTLLSAANGDQISTTYKEKGHGLFTFYFLKYVKDTLDADKTSKLDINKLYKSIKPEIEQTARKKNNVEQTPQLVVGDKKQRKLELM